MDEDTLSGVCTVCQVRSNRGEGGVGREVKQILVKAIVFFECEEIGHILFSNVFFKCLFPKRTHPLSFASLF